MSKNQASSNPYHFFPIKTPSVGWGIQFVSFWAYSICIGTSSSGHSICVGYHFWRGQVILPTLCWSIVIWRIIFVAFSLPRGIEFALGHPLGAVNLYLGHLSKMWVLIWIQEGVGSFKSCVTVLIIDLMVLIYKER